MGHVARPHEISVEGQGRLRSVTWVQKSEEKLLFRRSLGGEVATDVLGNEGRNGCDGLPLDRDPARSTGTLRRVLLRGWEPRPFSHCQEA